MCFCWCAWGTASQFQARQEVSLSAAEIASLATRSRSTYTTSAFCATDPSALLTSCEGADILYKASQVMVLPSRSLPGHQKSFRSSYAGAPSPQHAQQGMVAPGPGRAPETFPRAPLAQEGARILVRGINASNPFPSSCLRKEALVWGWCRRKRKRWWW